VVSDAFAAQHVNVSRMLYVSVSVRKVQSRFGGGTSVKKQATSQEVQRRNTRGQTSKPRTEGLPL